MGFFKEAGDSILKYGGILVNKTEEYTRIAKLNLEIKKNESDIEKCHKKMGRIMADALDRGESGLDLKQEAISSLYDRIKSLRRSIEEKRNEIETLKQEKSDSERENTKTASSGPGNDENI